MANKAIEELVEDYQSCMDSLQDRVKIDLEDYVRDVAEAAWNSALSAAEFEVVTCISDDGPEEMRETIKEDIQRLRI